MHPNKNDSRKGRGNFPLKKKNLHKLSIKDFKTYLHRIEQSKRHKGKQKEKNKNLKFTLFLQNGPGVLS